MPSLFKINLSIVLVTIFVINIFNTSAIEIINGKHSLDSQIDPIVNKKECDSYYTGNNKICDMNQYLTYPMKQKVGDIMEKSKAIASISCPFGTDGIEFGVFIMSSFNDYHSIKINQENYDIQEASKFYAKLFHEKWEIGNEECNNGILIFLNIKDRFIYISTSTYLKMNYISDQYINDNLLPSIRPYLRDGQYGEAIINLMESITDKCQQITVNKMIESEPKINNVNSQNDNINNHTNNHGLSHSFWTIIIITFLSIIFLIWFMKWTIDSCCCGCEDDEDCNDCCRNPRNVYVYNDEGRPSQHVQPQSGAYPQPGAVRNNGMNASIERNSYLRSRNIRNVENVHNVYNHYNQYPKQQFSASTIVNNNRNKNNGNDKYKKKTKTAQGGGAGMSFDSYDDNDRLNKERKEKEKKLKLENEKNSKLVNNGKRASKGGGAGMSWDSNIDTSSSSSSSRSSSNVKSSPKFKRTNADAGAGGSW